jgi:predicted PurR-regulated permease PerM
VTENTNQIQTPAPIEPETTNKRSPESPRWGWATKLVVGLLLIAGLLALIIRFDEYFKLVITAFIISFLLHPLCRLITKRLKISWRVATAIVYFLIAGLTLWLITSAGSTIIIQVQNLFKSLTQNVGGLTTFLETWSNRIITIGPFNFTLPYLDTDVIAQTITGYLQPAATQAGKLVGLVGGFLFNLIITYMVSFFITSETNGVQKRMININVKGFEKDFRRIGLEVSKIFNAFIRGEFTVVAIAIIVYIICLGILGLPYFLVLALIAGLGRFIPYIGAWIGWIGFIIGAILQDPTPYGLTKLMYVILVMSIAMVIDMVLDHVLTPKLMGDTLQVHPAAIMISALIGGQIFGLLGIILAAPTFATLKLLFGYATKKLFDQDPWEGMSYYRKPKEPALLIALRKLFNKFRAWLKKPLGIVNKWLKKTTAPLNARIKQTATKVKKQAEKNPKKKSQSPKSKKVK